ncbi:MAG: hypothetical protein WC011_01640 [Candidatus Paceibacterota bacterium]
MKNIFKNKKQNLSDKGGYTIIETMISISLFLIIVTMGMNSLLNANVILNKAKDARAIMDNLTFIMEDMSRNIRTGDQYKCSLDLSFSDPATDTESCITGGTISFREAITRDRWAYSIVSYDLGQTFKILKTIDADATPVNWVELTDEGIHLSNVSGFSVVGAEPLPGDTQQPFVNIRLVGEMRYKGVVTPFALQNSVSQTTIDIAE